MNIHNVTLGVLATCILAGCLVEPDSTSAGEESADSPNSGRAPKRSATFRLPNGALKDIEYEAVGGFARWQGDIDLGSLEDIEKMTESGVVNDLGKLWLGGVVPYTIDQTVTNPSTIVNGLALIATRTGVKFRQRTNEQDFIWFMDSVETGVSHSAIGKQGNAQGVFIWPGHGATIVAHEVGHALGLHHEQTRPDRDTYVTVYDECIIDEKEGNFDINADQSMWGPYDIGSFMHYRTGLFCDLYLAQFDGGPPVPTCVCPTILTATSPALPIDSTNNTTDLSFDDVNNLLKIYNQPLSTSGASDEYGASAVALDVDGDGKKELAIGAPGKVIGGVASGAVFVYKSTAYGLLPWRILTQLGGPTLEGGGPPVDVDEPGDQFGAALAAGDFNNDGLEDLAVGAPGEATNLIADGAVYVFWGTDPNPPTPPNPLAPPRAFPTIATKLTQSTFGAPSPAVEAGDQFGASLAVADIMDNDAFADLIVGVPNKRNFGLPSLRSGRVLIFRGGSSGFQAVLPVGLTQGALDPGETGDDFGHTLAVGQFDANGGPDLAVGAPLETSLTGDGGVQGAGAVYVFKGLSSGAPTAQQKITQATLGKSEADNDKFGAALATGRFAQLGTAGAAPPDLAVGAPGRVGGVFGGSDNAGAVYVLKSSTGFFPSSAFGYLRKSDINSQASDEEFGAHLVAVNFSGSATGFHTLVVGAPKVDAGQVANAGRVYLYDGDTVAMSPRFEWGQNNGGADADETNDLYGGALAEIPASIATVPSNGWDEPSRTRLFVGAKKDTTGGKGFVYESTNTSIPTVSLELKQVNHEEYWQLFVP